MITLYLTVNPLPPTPTLSASDNTSCTSINGSITVTAPLGDNYTYAINGGDPQSSNTFTTLSAGEYTITITDNNGCSSSNTAIISTVGNTVTAEASADSPCEGGDIILSATTTTTGVTFAWTGPDDFESLDQNPVIENATANNSGTYTVTVTETSTGCTATATATIAVRMPTTGDTTATACESFDWYEHTGITQSCDNLTHTFAGGNAAGCDSTVTLHLTVNHPVHDTTLHVQCGGSYTWSDGDGLTYSTSGDYLYSHPDANGCTQVDTLHLTILPLPDVPTLSALDNTSCLEPNGSVTVDAPTGTGYSYSIDGNSFQTGTSFNGLGTGSYTVTVMNEHGCTTTGTVSVSTVGNTVTAEASAEAPCEGGDIILSASTSTTGVTFDWTGPNSYTSDLQNPVINNANQNMDGQYIVTVTETATGCTNTASATVSVRMPTTGDTTATACESFTWHGVTYNETPANAPTYTIAGGNHNGCDSVVTLHLTVNHPVHTALTIEQCGGTYTWADVDGLTYSTSGDYTYSHPDANGCTQVDTLHLTIHPLPAEPTLSVNDNTSCLEPNGSITVDAPTGTGYSYSIDGDNFQTGTSFPGLGTGSYTVTVIDEFGCTNTATTTVSTVGNTVTVEASADSPCEGGDIVLSATTTTSGVTFDWTGPNSYTSDLQNPVINNADESMNGTYTVTVTESATGCTNTASATVSVRMPTTGDTTATACESFTWHGVTYNETPANAPTYTIAGGNHNGCDSVVTLHLTVNHPVHTALTIEQCGGTYTWADVDGLTYSTSGDYTYSHPDANGCTQVDTLHLTIHPLPAEPTLSVNDNTSCLEPNGSITVDAPTGTGYSYSIDGDNFQTGTSFPGLGTGSYTVTVIDEFGCTNTATTTVSTVGNTVTAEASAEAPCEGGDIILFASTSTTGVTFAWIGPDGFNSALQNPVIENVSDNNSGTYIVTVTETATGCTAEAYAIVAVRMPNTGDTTAVACEYFDWYEHTNITQSCDNLTHIFTNAAGCDSVVTLYLTVNHPVHTAITHEQCGGTFTWSDGNGVTYDESGDYNYEHEDANGCTQVDTLHLTIHPVPAEPTLSVNDNTSCLEPNGSVTVDAPTGTGYSYSIDGDNFQTGTSFPGLGTGSYTVTVIDEFGCTNTATTTVSTVGNTVTAEASADSPCEGGDIILSATTTTTGVTFDWTGPNNYTSDLQNPVINNADESMNGTYTVTVTETATGCTNTASATVAVRMPTTGDTTATACESFTWHGVTYNETPANAPTYTIAGGNHNGCDSVVTLHLTVNHPVHTALTIEQCGGTYTWADVDGLTYSTSGDYTYSHPDANGCTQVDTLHLTIHPLPAEPTLSVNDNTSCLEPNGSITVDAPTGTGYSYSIDGDNFQTGTSFPGLGTGSYTVTVIDEFGCTNTATTTVSTVGNTVTAEASAEAPCEGGDIILFASTSTTGVTFAWIGPDGFNSALQNPVIENVSDNNSGTYIVTVTETATGCTAEAYAIVAVRMPNTGDTTAVACEYFDWYEHTNITQSCDNLTHIFTNAAGCDSVVTLYLTVNHPVHTAITHEQCGGTFTWSDGNGVTYDESGDYNYEHEDANGCTQVDTLHLTIHPVPAEPTLSVNDNTSCLEPNGSVTVDAPTGTGYSYSIDGDNFQTGTSFPGLGTGSYTVTVIDEFGCTNTATTTVSTVGNTVTAEASAEAPCEGGDIILFASTSTTGVTFAWIGPDGFNSALQNPVIENVSDNNSGTYIVTVTETATGCTAEAYAIVAVRMPTTGDTTATACESFTWYGTTYSETPVTAPTHTFTNAAGCDSVVTLHLTVLQPSYFTVIIDTCDSFTWIDGITYTESVDTPTVLFTNAVGCDSIVTLDLTIRHSSDTTIHDTINQNDLPYTLNHMDYWLPGTYNQGTLNNAGCDSSITLVLVVNMNQSMEVDSTVCDGELPIYWNDITLNEAGDFMAILPAESGADSVVILHLFVNHSSDSIVSVTACNSFTWHGNTYLESTNTATFDTLNAVGCDSTVTLHLILYYDTLTEWNDTACEAFTWNDSVYTTSGDYTQHFNSIHGCDSAVTLHLTIHYNADSAIYRTACNEFVWNDSIYYQTGEYIQQFQTIHGCDSIVTLHLTIHHSDSSEFNAANCYFYSWNDSIYYESGDYTQTLQNIHGCDSVVTLHLIINDTIYSDFVASSCNSYTWNDSIYSLPGDYSQHFISQNECDSVVTLHLTLYYDTLTEWSDAACETYTWNDSVYTASGDYTQHFESIHGCDSAVVLHLTIHMPQHTNTVVTAYNSFVWNDSTYNSSGIYTFTHLDENGCTQVDTLHLTMFYTQYEEFSASSCEFYQWNDSIYTASGDYMQQFIDINGADSIVTLHLVINHPLHAAFYQTACESYIWNDSTYTASGTYTFSHLDENGCEQVDTLHLTIVYPVHASYTEVACESYLWNGQNYTSSGTYTSSHPDENGCTQVDTLHLTILFPTHSAIYDTACESFTWNDQTYTQSGAYTFAHPDENGCTQVDTLHLTIHHPSHTAISISACESYTWNGETYTESGDYTFTHPDEHGCTQVDTLHLTIHFPTHSAVSQFACRDYVWNGHTYSSSGTYIFAHPDENGCEQVDTLHLTFLEPSTTITPLTNHFCSEGQLILEVHTNLEDYVWSTGETSQTITVFEDGTYTVTASQGDCEAEATFTIEPCEQEILLPNAINPDGNGQNDFFSIPEANLDQINDFHFSVYIYNRWGTLVFSSTSKYFQWNGEVNGKVYHDNVYNYVIEYHNRSGAPRKKVGSIIVL